MSKWLLQGIEISLAKFIYSGDPGVIGFPEKFLNGLWQDRIPGLSFVSDEIASDYPALVSICVMLKEFSEHIYWGEP
jgi:hypothetical protein